MPGGTFDPYDWQSFYFGKMSRDEAQRRLSREGVAVGTFLLRDSSYPGDFSLSVRESNDENMVRHYLIRKIEKEDGTSEVKIAEQNFFDIATLLNHYKMRILDQASLTVPYRKDHIEKVVAIHRFDGERECDLPFEAGEELEIIEKTENQWWQARNALNLVGLIPANYVTSLIDNDREAKVRSQSSYESSAGDERCSAVSTGSDSQEDHFEPSLPSIAKIIFDRQPNAYDSTQLKLQKGHTIKIMKKMDNGQYQAELDGKVGFVPFTYVRFNRP
ncbi:unnamed protein product [Auanema sp. JU1783]|nr:unnamed protein product [Auanema sp. JU1783]